MTPTSPRIHPANGHVAYSKGLGNVAVLHRITTRGRGSLRDRASTTTSPDAPVITCGGLLTGRHPGLLVPFLTVALDALQRLHVLKML